MVFGHFCYFFLVFFKFPHGFLGSTTTLSEWYYPLQSGISLVRVLVLVLASITYHSTGISYVLVVRISVVPPERRYVVVSLLVEYVSFSLY